MGTTDREYFTRFNEKVMERRIPLFGTIDLTRQCNLSCVHCYLGNRDHKAGDISNEINTEKWIQIIDEITAAGCLHLLITGGEPLLKRDFDRIYRHAIQNGLLVTVFSNGTCVTESIVDVFSDMPPQAVEISLYGATPDTYERITRVKGSYEKCMKGITLLLDHGIRVALKTILMSVNRHEFSEMENMANRLGVKFRFDAALFPCLDGDPSPLDFRVSPEDAVKIEMADAERHQRWRSYYLRTRDFHYPDALYVCGAGLASFYIDPYARLHPCLMTGRPEFDLRQGGFQDGWEKVISGIHEQHNGIESCRSCQKIALCGYCPAFFRLETGDEKVRSEYLCEMGKHRLESICNCSTQGE